MQIPTRPTYRIFYLGLIAAGLTVSLLVRFNLLSRYGQQIFLFICINIIMTVSLNLINGFTGEFSIGHAAFMAIGAYSSVFVTTILFPAAAEWPKVWAVLLFLASIALAGLVSFGLGYVVGLPILRLRGDYLAIVTLALVEVVRSGIKLTDELACLLDKIHLPALSRIVQKIGGPRGIGQIPVFTNIFWAVAFTVLTVSVINRLLHSSFGRVFLSLREDQIAAEMMGVDLTRSRVLSFAIASFFAGCGGGLYAHTLRYIHPDNFNFIKSIEYLVYLYLGGMSSLWGSIIAAGSMTFLLEFLRMANLQQWRLVIYPLILILVMLRKPEGLFKRDL
ncbi:MAG: branched-chain amino acid ABC transporter permease [bacterium]|nr:branched-chain amino acid ABC transporter permease [bacterium]